jgi:protein arginine kinase activator
MQKICEVCKKQPATVHITDVSHHAEVHLCLPCAEAKGLHLKKPMSLPQFLKGKIELSLTPPEDAVACPHCQMTWEKFRQDGRLGCARDYDVFADKLREVFDEIHSAPGRHLGKAPRRQRQTGAALIDSAPRETETARRDNAEKVRQGNDEKTRRRYQQLLQDAIKREDYQEAARLRDLIATLTK